MRQFKLAAVAVFAFGSVGWAQGGQVFDVSLNEAEAKSGSAELDGPSVDNFVTEATVVNVAPIGDVATDVDVKPASTRIPLAPPRSAEPSIAASSPTVGLSNPIQFPLQDKRIRQVASALSVVIGVFLLFVVLNRTIARKPRPHEMIEVLGRTAVTPKHSLHLVRVHDRLILLAETPQGLQQLETMPSPRTEASDSTAEPETSMPVGDPEAERLLEMIRRSDNWTPNDRILKPGQLRDTSYVA